MASLREQLRARGLSPRTVDIYLAAIDAARRWCDEHGHDLRTISPAAFEVYAETTWFSASVRAHLRSAMRHYWAIVGRKHPPLWAIRVPSMPTMECKALDPGDARILAKAARAAGGRKGLAVTLGLYEAMRREEIACCRWDSFNDGTLTIVGKGLKTRRVPVHSEVVVALGDHQASGPYLFPGLTRPHVQPVTIWAWTRELSEAAGLGPVRTHVLRHTALASINDATGDLRTTQAIAGHARPETTSNYTRATGRRLRAAIDAIDYG